MWCDCCLELETLYPRDTIGRNFGGDVKVASSEPYKPFSCESTVTGRRPVLERRSTGPVTVNSPDKGFYGSEWQKNTTRNSINISLKRYFNIQVKGDLNNSTKISTDLVA